MYIGSIVLEHDVVRRAVTKLPFAESIVTDLGGKHGFEDACEKDGRAFLSKEFPRFDGCVFQTQDYRTRE